jgi:hypothetical protein
VPKSRLEAFSDGVIAILITIMVLELHIPAGARCAASPAAAHQPAHRDDRTQTDDATYATVGTETRSRRATCMLFSPSAHPNTIRLRNANACPVLRRAAHRSSCARSSSVNVISTGFGPHELIHQVYR